MGLVLSQVQNGHERPILFSSVKFSKSQLNYSATKGELAGIICALKKFRYYLQLRPFVVRTDAMALTHIKTMDHPSGMIQRLLDVLANYQFTVQHRAGKKHGNADALSRIDHAQEDPKLTEMNEKVLGMILALNYSTATSCAEEILEEQRNDPELGPIHRLMDVNEKPTVEMLKTASKEAQVYLCAFEELCRDESGLLRWKRPQSSDEPNKREHPPLLVTKSLQTQLVTTVYEENGHSGWEASVRRVAQTFYWPNMATTAVAVKTVCKKCQKRDGPPKPQ